MNGHESGPQSQRRRRALLALLAALVALPALLVLSLVERAGSEPPRPPLAAADGSFHPIAGAFRRDDTELEGCAGEARCLEQAFGNLAFDLGPREALRLFEERMAVDPAVERGCHRIAHVLGAAALARHAGDVAKTFALGSAACASGYYHGVLDRAFLGISSREQLAAAARSLCRGDGARPRGFLEYQCVHGLGHGLMIRSGYELPLALATCAGLATPWHRVSCSGGVFMENGSTSYGFRSRYLMDDDPLYPCTWVGARDRRSCYLRVTTRILELNGHDWARTARVCAGLAAEWARPCFRSLGRDAAGATRHEAEAILPLCRLAGSGEGECLYGAGRTVADNRADGAPAGELCRRAPEQHRAACFSGVGVVIGLLHGTGSERREACAALTRTHADACADAARRSTAPDGLGAWG